MCLFQFIKRVFTPNKSCPFCPLENANWNSDSAVLHHEVGHALVWYYYGEGIGRLVFRRDTDGLLEASLQAGPAREDQKETRQFIDASAERLLAGEVAARLNLGIPTRRMALRNLKDIRQPLRISPRTVAEQFAHYEVRICHVVKDDLC